MQFRRLLAVALFASASLFIVACADSETDDGEVGDPVPCGEVQCGGDQYCCDAACGLCAPMGVACTETC